MQLSPILAPNLFGFHLLAVGGSGEYLDELEEGLEISYVLVANQSAELQRETALVFLLQLLYRQRRQAEMKAEGQPIEGIDFEMARQDERALEEIRDVVNPLARGWSQAAKLIAGRAEELGFSLRVRYEVDPLPRSADVSARIPLHRQSYNELEVLRSSVDKVVSLLGGTSPRLATHGASEPRDFAQQRMALMHFREYTNQAVRDAEVCGNGYLANTNQEPIGLYNLRPEHVEILERPSGRIYSGPDEEIKQSRVAHVRGIEQQSSPYGMSLLEVALPTLRAAHLLSSANEVAERVLSGRPEKQVRESFQRIQEIAKRLHDDTKQRLDGMFWFPEKHLPDAAEHLYFPGSERM